MKQTFQIEPLASDIIPALQQKIDQKTKPLGALGQLERLALRVGQIQHTLEPALHNPHILVFAGDHGIAADKVSAYPQEVTIQMVQNFLAGGAAINVFARQHNMTLYVIDAGVNGDLPEHPQLLDRKIAPGTQNFRYEPAMTAGQCEHALQHGAELVRQVKAAGCNTIVFGEMGIGNTSSAAVFMSILGNLPIETCVGRGAGLDDEGLAHKTAILREAISRHGVSAQDPFTVLQTFGGFEIAMICGAFLQAAEERMVILVDGFIVSAALLVAARLNPNVLEYCLFSHLSDEPGHQQMLELLGADPLLRLSMRLGEGTGAVLAYPLVESAARFLNEMASFTSAGVSTKA